MLKNYILDHVGIAVSNIEKSINSYINDFGFSFDNREVLTEHQVEVAFLALPNTKIELIMPTTPDSPVSKFISKRGEGLHHICYEVSDIKEAMEELTNSGYTFIDKEPRRGAHQTLIAFMHPKSVQGHVLTELCEYT